MDNAAPAMGQQSATLSPYVASSNKATSWLTVPVLGLLHSHPSSLHQESSTPMASPHPTSSKSPLTPSKEVGLSFFANFLWHREPEAGSRVGGGVGGKEREGVVGQVKNEWVTGPCIL